MDCVYCGFQRVIKYGTRGGVQQYRCNMCGRQFNERSGTPFAGMRYTPQEVVLALRLRFKYRLICREVSELMAEMGHPVSPATVLFWINRFSDNFQELQRRYRPENSRIWHVDELHVRLRGGKAYVHVVEDENRCIISLTLSERRDKEAAARALRDAKAEVAFAPDVVMIYCNPAQLTMLLLGIAYRDGLDVASQLGGHAACVYAVVPPMKTGRCWVSTHCMGDRVRAMAGDSEMIFSLPQDAAEDLLRGLRHIGETGRQVPFGRTLVPEYQMSESYSKIARMLGMTRADGSEIR